MKKTNNGQHFGAITEVLQTYLDALYECSSDKIRLVFHPAALYATADESPTLIRDLPTYLAAIEQRVSPASRREARQDYIDSIEIAGANTARAQVRCSFSNKHFVDYLTLVQEDGRWQIISKVFQIQNEGAE